MSYARSGRFSFAFLTALLAAAIPAKIEINRAGASRLVAVMHFEFLVKRYVSRHSPRS